MSIRNIARLANVSPSTVSMALHGDPRIAESTRHKVLQVASEVGYRPDAKIAELMTHLRAARQKPGHACLGVISFYPELRPWDRSLFFARIYEGMQKRADMMGYRLEPFGLRTPGMTTRRLRQIVETRGIEGLACLGSPNMDEELPPDLEHFALVSLGLSIRAPLNRVITHGYNGMWHLLDRVYRLGYRRPGLAIGDYEGPRNAYAHLSAYLGWCNLMHTKSIPPARLTELEGDRLVPWLKRHKPDVLVLVHMHKYVQELPEVLKRAGLRIPDDVAVAAVSQVVHGTGMSGLEASMNLMGSRMMEMLVGQITHREFGIRNVPRIEMIEGQWVDGQSLPPLSNVVASGSG